MKYKKVQAYLKGANKILFSHSIGDAIELQNTLVNEFEKEGNEISNYIKSISFFPHIQTASNDFVSQERRAQALRNGVQELINILNQECNNQKEKKDNTRFWVSTIIAIISLILAIVSLKDILLPEQISEEKNVNKVEILENKPIEALPERK